MPTAVSYARSSTLTGISIFNSDSQSHQRRGVAKQTTSSRGLIPSENFLGVLLMGSLIIIPAATARHLARNLTGMLAISVAVAVVSTISGTYAAGLVHRETGPFIITIAGGIFFLILLT